ncbi:MAG: selenide, water dikinase SelD [Bacteroidales bacterium]|jgi:selenide,water dikinase|nr:selenide, water dikinase SelD [Bacteroidales bacterium]
MEFDLLTTVETGGCSSKIPPRLLEELLRDLPLSADPDILVDISTHDDAGVYKISEDLALVFTTDFFPPLVSDGYGFGLIAATNSISDIYAMGGKPLLALNIMMFPSAEIPLEVYSEILRGGYDKAREAGVSIIGGHSIDDYPPKYGLAVIGTVHPDKIITNSGVREGELLILTKPVGTGIILAGHRMKMTTDDQDEEARRHMMRLNNDGAVLMQRYGVRGATDITGFGLAGHALKMARGSGVTIRINMGSVPLMSGVYDLVSQGCIPGAAFRNLDYAEGDTLFGEGLDYNLRMISFDAQTSGGLLISVPEEKAAALLADLHAAGHPEAAVIGSAGSKRDVSLIIGE